MLTLLLATRNVHKIAEICAILGSNIDYLSLRDFPHAPEVIEDAATFEGNATKKAVELAKWVAASSSPKPNAGLPLESFVLADDSGLEVDALNGAPGVHSARFAALETGQSGNASDGDNNAKLLHLLSNVPFEKRTARFRCVLALAPLPHDQKPNNSPVCLADEVELSTELFQGACEGRIGFAPQGQSGFGYDPLFTPLSHSQTFAELGEALKNRISHRAAALNKLKARMAKISLS